jgi:hypothetical protein
VREILMAGKVGRPKREEDVTPILLRIPPALLKRVERCKARLEFQEGTSIPRTTVFWRILEAGCDTLEGQETQTEVSAHVSISSISEISDNIPSDGSVQDEERPAPMPQAQGTSITAPEVFDQVTETAPQLEPVAGMAVAEAKPQQTAAVPAYDPSKYRLGKLCPRQHDYHGTGQSLLRRNNQRCRECDRLGKRAARARRQQKVSA